MRVCWKADQSAGGPRGYRSKPGGDADAGAGTLSRVDLPPLSTQTRAGRPVRLLPSPDRWLIEVAAGSVGFVRLRPEGRQAEIDFALDEAARGAGVASAAVAAASRWALDPDGGALAALLWRAEVGNWPARRVVWACGYRVEGQVRGLMNTPDGVATGWIGALVAAESTQPLPWFEPPTLTTGEVTLRANRAADVPRIVEACADPDTQHFLAHLADPYDEAAAHAFLAWAAEEQASGLSLCWAIEEADEPGVLQGQVGLHGLAGGTAVEAEIGYWIHPDARRRGLARIALRTVARHALLPEVEGGLGLRRVLARAAATNEGSLRVIRTAGLQDAGRDRDVHTLRDGSTDDLLRFDLVADELPHAWAHPSALY